MPHLDVYGQDHSPWVQTVLLGLHEKGVSHRLTTVPPFSVFRKSGVMMPAASVDGEPWQLESAEILQRVGYEPVSPEDLGELYSAWNGVLHRPDSAARFFGESLLHHANPFSHPDEPWDLLERNRWGDRDAAVTLEDPE